MTRFALNTVLCWQVLAAFVAQVTLLAGPPEDRSLAAGQDAQASDRGDEIDYACDVGLDSYDGITLSITPNTPRPGDRSAMTGHSLVRQSQIGPVFFLAGLSVHEDGTSRFETAIPE